MAGNATLSLGPLVHGKYNDTYAPTSISLFDQGLVDVPAVAVTGLQPNHPYVPHCSRNPDGSEVRPGPHTLAVQDLAGWRSHR